MAVVHCKEVTGRDGSEDNVAKKRYTRTFQLLTDDPTDGAKVVKEHAELPGYGDVWEQVDAAGDVTDTDDEAFCVEKRVSQVDGENFQNWQVVCEYVGRGDPTREPADVQWNTTKFQKAVQRDADGKLIANSARDPFEAGLTKDANRFQVTITKNVLTWNPAAVASFVDTTNEDPFLLDRHPPGLARGTCKLSSLGATAVWYDDLSDIHYWKRTAVVEVDLAGWNAVPLDAGFQAVVSVPGVAPVGGLKKGKIVLADGTTPSTPQPLNGAGGKLPVGADPVYCDGIGGRPGPFVLYPLASWAVLELEY